MDMPSTVRVGTSATRRCTASIRGIRCTTAYDGVRSLADCGPWLGHTQHFPEEAIDLAWKRIPSAWVAGEEEELDRMLERLRESRARLGELISACRNARVNPFRNWPVTG